MNDRRNIPVPLEYVDKVCRIQAAFRLQTGGRLSQSAVVARALDKIDADDFLPTKVTTEGLPVNGTEGQGATQPAQEAPGSLSLTERKDAA